jgi:hypothetical protein
MSIKLNSVGGGSVTIQEPNTASDFTLSVPAATADLLTSSSDLTTQVKSATNATGSAPVYACRAWVNFNGTGTPAIRASGNVSSITDNGVGDYTVNFTTAMPDVNYAVNLTCGYSGAVSTQYSRSVAVNTNTYSTSAFRLVNQRGDATQIDHSLQCVSVFR